MSIELLSPDGRNGLETRPSLPESALERGSPSIKGYTYHADDARAVKCVVWGAAPYRIHPKQRPDFEFSLLLEGSVTLTDMDGTDTRVEAGDAFVLPPGCTYQWGQDCAVLKYAVSFTPHQPPPPGLKFTPLRAHDLREGQAPRMLFESPDESFSVQLEICSGAGNALTVGPGNSLVTAVAGSVSIHEGTGPAVQLPEGQSAFIDSTGTCRVLANESARLLVCTVHFSI